MDMSAYFLTCFRGPEDSDNGNSWYGLMLGRPTGSGQLRIELGWRSLVVVDAVEPDAKEIH